MTNRTTLVLLDPATEVRSSALELFTIARSLGRVEAVTLEAPTVEVLAQLGAYGVETVHQAELPASVPGAGGGTDHDARHLTSVVAATLTAAVRRVDADVVLAPATFAAKEAVAVAAFHLGAGLVIDAAGVSEDGEGRVVATKRVFAGTWDTESVITTDVAVLTVRANAVVASPAPTPVETVVEGLTVDVEPPAVTVVSRSVKERVAGRPALEEAAVVVAGGRGTNGDFGPVNDLADALGAAIGATRDVVFEGWFDKYVGQTGVTIAPRLYVGAGISGAPHHRGGMQASQVIVAVNNDPEAPIFEICDFAVVGDLADVLPQAAAAIRAHRGE